MYLYDANKMRSFLRFIVLLIIVPLCLYGMNKQDVIASKNVLVKACRFVIKNKIPIVDLKYKQKYYNKDKDIIVNFNGYNSNNFLNLFIKNDALFQLQNLTNNYFYGLSYKCGFWPSDRNILLNNDKQMIVKNLKEIGIRVYKNNPMSYLSLCWVKDVQKKLSELDDRCAIITDKLKLRFINPKKLLEIKKIKDIKILKGNDSNGKDFVVFVPEGKDFVSNNITIRSCGNDYNIDIGSANTSCVLKDMIEDMNDVSIMYNATITIPSSIDKYSESFEFVVKVMAKLHKLGYTVAKEYSEEELNWFYNKLSTHFSNDLSEKNINQCAYILSLANYFYIKVFFDVVIDKFLAMFDSGSVSLESLNVLLNKDFDYFRHPIQQIIIEKVEQFLRNAYLKNSKFELVSQYCCKHVDGVKFSPDGKMFAHLLEDGSIELYSVEKGSKDFNKKIITLNNCCAGPFFSGIKFSPDGKIFASSLMDNKTVKLWNVNKGSNGFGKKIKILDNGWPGESIKFSPDGKIVSCSSHCYQSINLWGIGKYRYFFFGGVKSSNPGERVDWFKFSPDGKLLACKLWGGPVKLWNVYKDSVCFGKAIITLYNDEYEYAHHIKFSPDCKILACTLEHETDVVELWNVYKGSDGFGKKIKILNNDVRVYSIKFSPDGNLLACSLKDGTIKLWNVYKGSDGFGKKIKILNNDVRVSSIKFSPDGNLLAYSLKDESIKLWNVYKGSVGFGKEIKALSSGMRLDFIKFTPNGKMFVCESNDTTSKLWMIFEDADFEALNNIKNLSIKQMIVLYFLINQHKKEKSLTLDGKAKYAWKSVDGDTQVFINKLLQIF